MLRSSVQVTLTLQNKAQSLNRGLGFCIFWPQLPASASFRRGRWSAAFLMLSGCSQVERSDMQAAAPVSLFAISITFVSSIFFTLMPVSGGSNCLCNRGLLPLTMPSPTSLNGQISLPYFNSCKQLTLQPAFCAPSVRAGFQYLIIFIYYEEHFNPHHTIVVFSPRFCTGRGQYCTARTPPAQP